MSLTTIEHIELLNDTKEFLNELKALYDKYNLSLAVTHGEIEVITSTEHKLNNKTYLYSIADLYYGHKNDINDTLNLLDFQINDLKNNNSGS